ncbi:MAG: 2-hydroxyacyl-CoA dehydratase, partial [Desulfatiglandales bacterium]|nr:2-hydroxyacyl-CoA dehydratase [Desulfatiglandales bacterium]
MSKYPSEPLKCWDRAKELRLQYYKDYATAHEKGGLRWCGGSWAPSCIPRGFGDDLYSLTSEPYSAVIAFDKKFSIKCMEAAENAGYPRDICSYMLNYVGSVVLNEYAFGGPFPIPDFIFQAHICCTHAKWYQDVKELEGGVPMYGMDMGVGAYPPFGEMNKHRIDYVAGQLLDGIDWIEKTIKRPFDEERFLEAVWTELRTMSLWPKIAELNQAVPAPMDEKSMFALYVLATYNKSWKAI